jgi:hypothetical protein
MSRADCLEGVRGALPDAARDIKLNLQSVLAASSLSEELRVRDDRGPSA